MAALGLLLLALAVSSASAQDLVRLRVVGAQTVQPAQVVAWSGLTVGSPVSRDSVAEAVRKIFATGKFADVFVYEVESPSGVELILNVTENPRVADIRFVGLKKIKQKVLEEKLGIRVGDFVSPAKVQRSTETMRDHYRSEGYYNATVTIDTAQLSAGGRQTLVYEVVEGKKVKVQKIVFHGNQELSADKLRGGFQTKEDGFLSSGTFKAPEFDLDLERVVTTYRDEGFLDAEVQRHEMEFLEEDNKIRLHIHVTEGQRYQVGSVTWSGNTVIGDERISRVMALETGEVFRENLFKATFDELNSLYWEEGYIYITVSPRRNIEGNVVDLQFDFQEGTPAHVRQIQIAGNTKTHENVIRREMRLRPGDLFKNGRLRDSQRDIFQLGFFNDVKVDFRQAPDPNDIDLQLEVEERQTGQFTMGVGFSQQTQASGFFNIGENNLFGRGQSLQFAWQFGRRRNFLDVSFTEPWFLGTPTLIGVDVFNRFSNRINDFYDNRTKGFAVRLGRPIPNTRFSSASIRYSLTRTTLSNFDPFYVSTLDNLERELGAEGVGFQRLDQTDWPQTTSGVTVSLTRNSTDSPFFPTGGSRSSLRYTINGGLLGGDLDYQRMLGEYDVYQPLPLRFAFHTGAAVGYLGSFGGSSDVPDYERFRLGGNRFFNLRGYEDLQVVPEGNPGFIGGRFYTTLTTELLFPVSRAIQLLAFVDQGDSWNSFSEADLTNLRTGAGFGVRLEVPLVGRIGLDYGYGFDKANPGWEAHFNFGTIF